MKIFFTIMSAIIFTSVFTFNYSQIKKNHNKKDIKVFLLDEEILKANKEKIKSGNTFLTAAFNQLYSDAESALDKGPFSVTFKNKIPPGGDKHDYMSLGPYWWPDSSKPDGLPYIRKDGVVNPEVSDYTDKQYFVELCRSVHLLALAYNLTDEEKFASHAANLLKVWFIDDETKMNPNFKYGQAIPGRSAGRSVGLIEARHFTEVIDAIGLIRISTNWDENSDVKMKKWFEEYFIWLIESQLGIEESEASNNHGTFYDVQAAAIALYLDKLDFAKNIFETAKEKRIAKHIEPDGRQPEELARTKALSYSAFNLEALFHLALLAEHAGVDLWNYQSDEGSSIQKALDYVLPYVLKQKEWPYQQITKFEYSQFYSLLLVASAKLKNNIYTGLVDKYKDKFRTNYFNLLYGKF